MRALLVTDLDGTLLDGDQRIGDASDAALRAIGERDVVRAVATGRSLHSVLRVLRTDAPIDYLIFSSGAGAVRFEAGALEQMLVSRSLDETSVRRAATECVTRGMNVLVHAAVPASHRFGYVRQHGDTDCLDGRIERYRPDARTLPLDDDGGVRWDGPACQVLALPAPGDPDAQHRALSDALPGLHVVRTTSPLDGRSLWLEVFPAGVSKASAAQWLAAHCGVEHRGTYAVGNDYNDADLLRWAQHAAVVDNAPADLRQRFDTVAGHDRDGVADAIARFGL